MDEDDSPCDFLYKIQQEMYEDMERDEIQAKANLPRATAAKKMKFLRAIGADDQIDSAADVNIEDENLHLTELQKICIMIADTSRTPLPFDDSIVVHAFMDIIRPEFDLKTYVSCVKRLYDEKLVSPVDMCYLLCHARDFSAPRNNLFTFSDNGTQKLDLPSNEATLSLPQPTPFTAKLITLMDDLLVNYSEAKYQQLNINVTYMLLLMTRKIFKDKLNFTNAMKKAKIHVDFVNLCPRPLAERLPDDLPLLHNEINKQVNMLFTLILYAYMKSTRLTRRVLVATCISQMEYTGLGLPMMFDKVVELYRVPEARLWDALCIDANESMFTLADFHHDQKQGEDEVPPKTYTLFPYCRTLNARYHKDLSCKNNRLACYAMSCLIDEKIGVDKSHMRQARWFQECLKNTDLCNKGKTLVDGVREKISGS